MEVLCGYKEIKKNYPNPIVTIGNFDGLHLGHKQIIQTVTKRAKAEKGFSVVYTFKPHPHLAISPNHPLQLLNTYEEKIELLENMGVDLVVEEPFSREFSNITPEKFLSDILLKTLSTKVLYVGYDFKFGNNRTGNLEFLQNFCKKKGIELYIAKPLKVQSEICSSSRIRNYLLEGNVSQANKLLGREFFYRGLVVRGDGRGRKIGFATANVKSENKLSIKTGVYATWAVYQGKVHASVTNVGTRPTFHPEFDAPIVVETHILDFNRDIYGEVLEVRIVERLRDELKFKSIDELIANIKNDIAQSKTILIKDNPL